MEYLTFRYTKTKYKLPTKFDNEVKRVDPDDIEERLKNEVKAIFLSGGLDSSLLAAIGKPKIAYVAHFPEFEYDEVKWAKLVAEYLGIELKVIEIKRDRYMSTIEYLIKQKKDGLHPNEPCIYLLALQAKKDGYDKVVLGSGADGLFGGYTDLLINENRWMANKQVFIDRYAYVEKDVPIPFKKWKEWGMYRFLLEIHTPGLIDRAINACSSAGVEPVFPYLENGIPQLMWNAPMGQKIDKIILKEIANKYLPREIIYRRKTAFPVPWDAKEFMLFNKEIGW